MNNQQKWIAIVLGAVFIGGLAWLLMRSTNSEVPAPNNDNTLGEPVATNMIRVDAPRPNQVVESPLIIRGEARGNWYFEASFPARLLDAHGKELAAIPVPAHGDWMTENFVLFETALRFETPTTETGTLVLEKDNPSGLPQNAAEVRIPVRFVPASGTTTVGACRVTGCSSQVCADEDVVTTCEYRAEYSCYANARCERQANGECGWTETAELKSCLIDAPLLDVK